MKLIKRKRKTSVKEAKQSEMKSRDPEADLLSSDLLFNETKIKDIFNYPTNHALKIRKIYIPLLKQEGLIFFVDGASNSETVEKNIIEPLLTALDLKNETEDDNITILVNHVLTSSAIEMVDSFKDTINQLINGNTIVLLDRSQRALAVNTAGFESRSVDKPSTENSLKGPKEAFIESMSVNASLIRKQLRDPQLTCEVLTIGEKAPSQVSVLYINDIADPEIVEAVKKRVTSIQSDAVLNLSILEQHIEERPYSLIASTMTTERPDRACGMLLEGHVILLMNNSPGALVVPVTFWTLFHSGEDLYLRWPDGNFIRLIRLFAAFVALLTPSLYIAVSNFHVEMLPTDLMLAIAATRERVPFASILEVLFMEITFEILREAGVRIPTVIGPTIGIVGALILGQAAVDANIVSPILVIIVAITGLSSFALPEISFNFAIRLLRFVFLIAATIIGFFGIALVGAFMIAYLASLKSFGVPFLSPMAPHLPSSKDLILRPPVWKQYLRPKNMSPQDSMRKKKPEGS